MAGPQAILKQLREICLALPDTKETLTWGEPHFRVGEKIFAGFGEDQRGKSVIGFKLELAHAYALIDNERFCRAPYVGRHGWVSMDATGKVDWDAVRSYLNESYRLIAPKASLAKLKVGATAAAAWGTRPRAPVAARKSRVRLPRSR